MTSPDRYFQSLPGLNLLTRKGFSLIEVIFALGIFLITILAMVGLLGPTLKSISDIEKTDEVVSAVNTVNSFLQSSPYIGDEAATPPVSKFEAIFRSVLSDNQATLFVYRYFDSASSQATEPIRLEVGFAQGEPVGAKAIINTPDNIDDPTPSFADAAGPIFRVVMTVSPVVPVEGDDLENPEGAKIPYRAADRNDNLIYTFDSGLTFEKYAEGFLALEVRIWAEDPGPNFEAATDLGALAGRKPLFTYNTAITR